MKYYYLSEYGNCSHLVPICIGDLEQDSLMYQACLDTEEPCWLIKLGEECSLVDKFEVMNYRGDWIEVRGYSNLPHISNVEYSIGEEVEIEGSSETGFISNIKLENLRVVYEVTLLKNLKLWVLGSLLLSLAEYQYNYVE